MAFVRINPVDVWGDAPAQDAVDAFKSDLLALCDKHALWIVADYSKIMVGLERTTSAIDTIEGVATVIETLPAGSLCK